jgi:hypothetical protein
VIPPPSPVVATKESTPPAAAAAAAGNGAAMLSAADGAKILVRRLPPPPPPHTQSPATRRPHSPVLDLTRTVSVVIMRSSHPPAPLAGKARATRPQDEHLTGLRGSVCSPRVNECVALDG